MMLFLALTDSDNFSDSDLENMSASSDKDIAVDDFVLVKYTGNVQ